MTWGLSSAVVKEQSGRGLESAGEWWCCGSEGGNRALMRLLARCTCTSAPPRLLDSPPSPSLFCQVVSVCPSLSLPLPPQAGPAGPHKASKNWPLTWHTPIAPPAHPSPLQPLSARSRQALFKRRPPATPSVPQRYRDCLFFAFTTYRPSPVFRPSLTPSPSKEHHPPVTPKNPTCTFAATIVAPSQFPISLSLAHTICSYCISWLVAFSLSSRAVADSLSEHHTRYTLICFLWGPATARPPPTAHRGSPPTHTRPSPSTKHQEPSSAAQFPEHS